jgi:hypothetical protein
VGGGRVRVGVGLRLQGARPRVRGRIWRGGTMANMEASTLVKAYRESQFITRYTPAGT